MVCVGLDSGSAEQAGLGEGRRDFLASRQRTTDDGWMDWIGLEGGLRRPGRPIKAARHTLV